MKRFATKSDAEKHLERNLIEPGTFEYLKVEETEYFGFACHVVSVYNNNGIFLTYL